MILRHYVVPMPESLYSLLLLLHSYWRWIVLIVAVVSILISFAGWLRNLPAKPWARLARLPFIIVLDLQLVLGLVLSFVSPVIREALKNVSAAMKDRDLRFFLVEHSLLMLVALVIAHVGSARCKRSEFSRTTYLKLGLWYSASLIVILVGTPWGRPLLRMISGSYE